MFRPRPTHALFAVLILAGSLVPAQQSPDENQPNIRTQVNVVIAPTTVTDKDGRFVNGIAPHEFRLYDNGKPQDIRVDAVFQPISLVVAIQRNAAAEQLLPKIQKIGSLLDSLVLGDKGQAAIVQFDHRVEVLQDFTSSPDRIKIALEKLKPGGQMNAMVDAATESIRMLRRRPPDQRRVLLLISETRQNGSEGKLRDALTDAQFANVSVYTVNMNRLITTLTKKPEAPRPSNIPPGARHLPHGAPQTPEAVAAYTGENNGNAVPLLVEIFKDVKSIFVDNPAEVLTKYTGGKEYSFMNQRALEQAIADIGEELHSQYMISYSPSNKMEAGLHEIKVEVMRPGLEVRTRRGYWIAANPF